MRQRQRRRHRSQRGTASNSERAEERKIENIPESKHIYYDTVVRTLEQIQWSAVLLLYIYALTFAVQEVTRLVEVGSNIWETASPAIRRRARSKDADQFASAWRYWLEVLTSAFLRGFTERLFRFFAVRIRSGRAFTVFIFFFFVRAFRIHSQAIILLDNLGLESASDFIIQVCSYIPLLGDRSGLLTRRSVSPCGEAYDDVPDLYDEDEETEKKFRTRGQDTFHTNREDTDQGGFRNEPTSNDVQQGEVKELQGVGVTRGRLPSFPPPPRPDSWLVFDKVYGVIPYETAEQWRKDELERLRRKQQLAANSTRPKVRPPVRQPVRQI